MGSRAADLRDLGGDSEELVSAPLLLGLGGRLRSGKDTVADRLVSKHGFVKFGMSDPLLEHALIVDPWINVNAAPTNLGGLEAQTGVFVRLSGIVDRVGYVEAKKNPEVRRFLQKSGTEGGRQLHGEDVWVNVLASKIDLALANGHSVVITGIRFPNEVRMIHQFAGLSMWVDRPAVDSDTPASGHASESSVAAEDFDRVITNDGTLEDLYAAVDRFMEERKP